MKLLVMNLNSESDSEVQIFVATVQLLCERYLTDTRRKWPCILRSLIFALEESLSA